jgi:hypothetical protein
MMSVGLLIPMASEKAYLDKAISRYSPEVAATARAGSRIALEGTPLFEPAQPGRQLLAGNRN